MNNYLPECFPCHDNMDISECDNCEKNVIQPNPFFVGLKNATIICIILYVVITIIFLF